MENDGLQKLTELQSIVDHLFKKPKIEMDDIRSLGKEAKDLFWKTLEKRVDKEKDTARDKLLKQVDGILHEDTKNQFWENNHYLITSTIAKLMREMQKMPSKNQIAEDCGLSRQTVHKHLKDFSKHPLYANEVEKFKFMAHRVLSSVFTAAVNGDIKASRLYFEAIGFIGDNPGNNTFIQTQNNYIQINQVRFTQETLKLLSEQQLFQIEEIIKSVQPVPEIFYSRP